MSHTKQDALIPAPAQLVIDYYDNELADLKFADMDRNVLQESLAQVQTLAEEQARAEAALRAAQENLQAGLDGFLGKCQRALAYARVYAEDNADLSRRLEAIVIPRRGRSPGPSLSETPESRGSGKRGRPRSAVVAAEKDQHEGTLFVEVADDAAEPTLKNGHHGRAAVIDREARSAAVIDREARSAAVIDREARSAA